MKTKFGAGWPWVLGTPLVATLITLASCAVGQTMGLVIGRSLGWNGGATILLATALACASAFSLTTARGLRRGLGAGEAISLALAVDTLSVMVIEVVANVLMLLALSVVYRSANEALFWATHAGAMVLAGMCAYPVNRALMARGEGQALLGS